MKNVFVEGIQGMGKSTLVNRLEAAVPELHVYREGDHSPWTWPGVRYFWFRIIAKQFAGFSQQGYRKTAFNETKHLPTFPRLQICRPPGKHRSGVYRCFCP